MGMKINSFKVWLRWGSDLHFPFVFNFILLNKNVLSTQTFFTAISFLFGFRC